MQPPFCKVMKTLVEDEVVVNDVMLQLSTEMALTHKDMQEGIEIGMHNERYNIAKSLETSYLLTYVIILRHKLK